MEICTVEGLKASLSQGCLPRGLSPEISALWYAAKSQFLIDELVDVYAAIGSPFNGGGTVMEAAELDYGVEPWSPAWCWVKAHTITQTIDYGFRVRGGAHGHPPRDDNDPSTLGSFHLNWVHGHLHRLESDGGNAESWYKRGLKQPSTVGLEEEWQSIAGELLAAQNLCARSFATQLSPLAASLVCSAPPLPLRFDPAHNPLTYTCKTFDRRIPIDEAISGPVTDITHAVGFVAALYALSGDMDESHALLLGQGSPAGHPPLDGDVGTTLKYLHAIVHRTEGRILGSEGEGGGISGHDNCEYWLSSGAAEHPLLARLGAAARFIGGAAVESCCRDDGRWDPNAFNRLIEKGGMSEAEEDQCQRMAEAEMGLLLDDCHHMATGGGGRRDSKL